MNSSSLGVYEVVELAFRVLGYLGTGEQADSEVVWGRYEDEQVCIREGIVDNFFHVYSKRPPREPCLVLDAHLVSGPGINSEEEFRRDVIRQRAYRNHQIRLSAKSPGTELDDWLRAESEVVPALEKAYPGRWEVAEWRFPYSGAHACILMQRGEWLDHLLQLEAAARRR